ncbi:MAG TPA: MarR family transcriptional regulator, partial [Caulobacteraceae bacterium]|nr:MarR family transcriptional regulator [Caulobacteraceae bacterium]
MGVSEAPGSYDRLAELLQRFSIRIGQRPEGPAAAVMRRSRVTASQMLVLERLSGREAWMPSALARSLGMSAPAVSQMLDRLHQLRLVERMENPDDRRQRSISATPEARALVQRVIDARTMECAASVAKLSGVMKRELTDVISRALKALED